MSIVVVTGMGPRTGTSFVMQQAIKAGLPIKGIKFPTFTIPQHNPKGYWEASTTIPEALDGNVVKLWTLDLVKIDHKLISNIIVLERKDKLAQVHSMYKTFKDECKQWPELAKHFTPTDILYHHNNILNLWLNQRDQQTIMRVHTEDLNESIADVIRFMKRGLTWA
jgi:hypothetical protein